MHTAPSPEFPAHEAMLEHLGRIFSGVPDAVLAEAAAAATLREFQDGDVLIQEGLAPRGVFVLLDGRLGIFTQDANGHVARIRVVAEPGALLGEQSMRDGRRVANATVIALTPGRAALVPPVLFRDLLAADAQAAARLEAAGRQQAVEKVRALSAELAADMRVFGAPAPRQFPAGATIHSAGAPATTAWFVISGQVGLFPPGCPVPHETVGPGILFGEREALAGTPRPLHAVAATITELLEIPAEVLRSGDPAPAEGHTTIKALAFVHRLPQRGAAYRFLAEVDGRHCLVTDYAQPDGRRIRVRHFPQEQVVEAGAAEGVGATEAVSSPSGDVSLLVTTNDHRLAGLVAPHDWPGLPDAMAALLRGATLEGWQRDALRSSGAWMAEAAAERAVGGSDVVCACTGATVTALRLAARGVHTVEELVRTTGVGSVCGGCRSRLPSLVGEETTILCRLETEPLCEGAVRAHLRPATSGALPVAAPGQHVQVEALLDDRWVGRPYTLTGFGPDAYELGVKIEEGGLFSNWMRQAPPGALVRVSGPQGTLCPDRHDPRPLVCIVAGIGVTAAVAAVRALAGARPLVVHYVYRSAAAAPYLAELRDAAARHGVVLREACTSMAPRPQAAQWRAAVQALAPCEVIACGPERFNQEVLQACEGVVGVDAAAESFLHPRRGEGAIPAPGSWRIPGFRPDASAGEPVPVKSSLPLVEEAERFLRQFFHETGVEAGAADRLAAVRAEIAATGTWTQSPEELGFAARVAWRNAERCVGRLYWRGLHLRDCRHVGTAQEVADALFDHLRFAFNGGDLRPAISVFAPGTAERPGPRIWNPQLLRYAGVRLRTGKQVGDPAQNELTRRIMRLGWEPAGTDFDLLPLVVEFPGEAPRLFELPDDCRQEVRIVHPQHPWVAELGLRWHGVPAVSDMWLDAGGIGYRLAPFNGWYLDAEIAARNFTDTNRYNLLPAVAEAMGLDVARERTLWRDKAMLLLNEAVLHSFDRDGVRLSDHHEIGHEFLEFCRNEQQAGREPHGKWMWLVPPVGASASVLYQEPFRDVALKPAFRYQDPVWHGRPD